MKRWPAAAWGLVALLSIAFGQEENEPVYHGKKLSYWLLGYAHGSLSSNEESARAEEAVHELGTNVIPTVLRMMEALDKELNVAGMYAFVIAKTNLASAVPGLARIYERAVSDESMRWVAGAFGNLGASAKDAAPVLVRGLNHPSRDVRQATAGALMNIRGDARVVVPALIEVLRDPRSDIKDYALTTLAQYGEAAKSALPEVLAIYRREGAQVAMDSEPRWSAEQVLRGLAPQELDGVLAVEDEEVVKLNYGTTMDLYAAFAGKGAILRLRGDERSVMFWVPSERPFSQVTGGRFEFYRSKNPPESGTFLRSEFEVEEVTQDRAAGFISVPDIRYGASGGKLFLTARDPKGKPLNVWRVRREDWDDWAPVEPQD